MWKFRINCIHKGTGRQEIDLLATCWCKFQLMGIGLLNLVDHLELADFILFKPETGE